MPKFFSTRVIEAKDMHEALQKAYNGEFIETHDESDTIVDAFQYFEAENIDIYAEQIINSLLDIIEKECPETYSGSNEVAQADDWLRWLNGELSLEDIHKYFPKAFNN